MSARSHPGAVSQAGSRPIPRTAGLDSDHARAAAADGAYSRLPRYGARKSAAACPQGLGAAPSWHATHARPVVLPPSSGFARQGQAVRSTSACAVPDRGVVTRVAPGSVPGAAYRRSSGWLAFSWCRLPLPLGGSFGSQSATRGRVDALVAVVPADPIARRGIAAQHFLNDTRAGSAVR
jgi:hypothetical protein